MDHKIGIAKRPSSGLDARIVKTRSALRESLVALAGEKPFAELTVGEIAKRAGVGYATFFRHYPGKDALLADIAESLILDILGLMKPLIQATETRAASLALVRFVDARRPICYALLVGAGDAMRREIALRANMLTERNRTDKVSDLPAELSNVHSVGATLNILAWWLERGADVSPDAMAAILDRLVLTPLSDRPDRACEARS